MKKKRRPVRLKLDQVLKEKGITKYRFAKLLGVDNSNVSTYFKESYRPTLTTLEKWAHVLDCKIGDLLDE